jgi:hypothetical protein
MILSTYQPFFAPFPLFYMKAHLSSAMVILDDVQFPQRTTWLTRNRFKNDQGILWLSIPVWRKGLGLQKIKDVRICSEGSWARKHLASLKTSYANAPYLSEHLDFVSEVFSGRFGNLLDLNMTIIEYLKKSLMIDTPIILQSHLGIKAEGSQLLIEICRKMGSRDYVAQASAKKYLNQELFSSAGISLHCFTPRPPIYPQLWGDFVYNLSTFDLLFNCGPKSHEVLGLGTSLK